eukprot:Skav200399  [mRNA]  locus=scaffold1919:323838:324965:- [translate_table: standard]
MLHCCKENESSFSHVDRLTEKVVESLADMYPSQAQDTEGIDDIKTRLRGKLEQILESSNDLEDQISKEINEKWDAYTKPKEEELNKCEKTGRMRVESLSESGEEERVRDLVATDGWRIVEVFAPEGENGGLKPKLEAVASENLDLSLTCLATCVEKHFADLEKGSQKVIHVLMSKSRAVKEDEEMLPQCDWGTPRCCLPRFVWCPAFVHRMWRSCILEHFQEPLSSTPGGSQFADRTCSLGFCKVKLQFALQEQLLFALLFATLLFIFNIISVISGFMYGCKSHVALPCGQMLFQKILSILCTFIYIISVIHCLQKEPFKKLEKMVVLHQMVDQLQELAYKASEFKDGLKSVDELCNMRSLVRTERLGAALWMTL